MKSYGGSVVSWVVVFMAASSLLSMIGLFQIDRMVHNDLYQYGLRFSYRWAIPYWTMTALVFALGWSNIIAAIAVHLYSMAFKRKEVEQLVTAVEEEISKTTTSTETGEEQTKPEVSELAETKETEQTAATATPESTTGSEAQEKKEEKQKMAKDASSQGQAESNQKCEQDEELKGEEPTPEESNAEQKQPPIIAGVSQEEFSEQVQEPQQQA